MMIGNMTGNELSPWAFRYHSRNSFQASIGPPDSTIPSSPVHPLPNYVSAYANSAAVNLRIIQVLPGEGFHQDARRNTAKNDESWFRR